MKPILFSIVLSVISLSNTNIDIIQIDELQNFDNISAHDAVYMNQKLTIKSEDIFFIKCSGCHGGNGMESVSSDFHEKYDSKITVHQESKSKFIPGLEAFVESHNIDKAAAKNVNYDKVVELIANY